MHIIYILCWLRCSLRFFHKLLGKFRKNIFLANPIYMIFPGGSACKESTYNMGELGSIPGLGKSPGEGNSYPLQFSCLENPMDRGT